MRVKFISFYELMQRVSAKTVIRIRIINSFYIYVYIYIYPFSLYECLLLTVPLNTNKQYFSLSLLRSLSLSLYNLPLQLIRSHIR